MNEETRSLVAPVSSEQEDIFDKIWLACLISLFLTLSLPSPLPSLSPPCRYACVAQARYFKNG